MNAPLLQYPSSQAEDEIDLFELFSVLWKKKLVIAAFTLLAAAVAASYAFTTSEQWTSVAYVSTPRTEQIKAYLEQRRALARVGSDKAVDPALLAKDLFANFVDLVFAQRTKLEFLRNARYYKELTTHTDAEGARQALIRLASKNLQVKPPGKDLISPYYTISFTADTAETAQQVLSAYITAANKKTFERIDSEFRDRLNASILSRQATLADIEFKLKSNRENQISTLQTALLTANRAGLKDYIIGRNITGNTVIELRDANRLFMLGEKYLTAELSTAKDSPLIFPPNYYDIERELDLLRPLLKSQVAAPYSYSFQLAPTLPTMRDKPKRGLIIVLGALLGGMVGFGWVLIAEATKKHRTGSPQKPLPSA